MPFAEVPNSAPTRAATVSAGQFDLAPARTARYNSQVTREQQEIWATQWKNARGALDRVRTLELAALSPAAALEATDTLLSLVDLSQLSAERLRTSGLVEQQRLLQQLRR